MIMKNFDPSNYWSGDFNKKISEHITALVDQHQLAVANLTKQQFVDVIKQMILAGDFVRYTRITDSAQTIVYIPGRGMDELQNRILFLEELCRKHNIDTSPYQE